MQGIYTFTPVGNPTLLSFLNKQLTNLPTHLFGGEKTDKNIAQRFYSPTHKTKSDQKLSFRYLFVCQKIDSEPCTFVKKI